MGGSDRTSSGSAPSARVRASGRVGVILAHDPDDKLLSYKLAFSDGETPEVDWFALDKVEVLSGDAQLEGTQLQAQGAAGPQQGLEKWASSRPAGTPVADEGFICAGTKAPICPPEARPAAPQAWAADPKARPAGTPVMDEGFICMGGKAPKCPAPAPRQASGPITLDVLQGEWLGSGGAQITILGTDVAMNGLPLRDHKVELSDDGTVSSIGRLWQLDRWAPAGDGTIEFRASSTRENMECARLEVWTRRAAAASSWFEKMQLMGYAGSSANPLERGIEGCMPGTTGAEMSPGFNQKKDAEEVGLLVALVAQWREPKTLRVRSRQVVPDFMNRAQTGLGVELMHYVATSMGEKGFQKRVGSQGHDIPVVVREPPASATREEALKLWRQRVSDEEGFPPVRVEDGEDVFTSLGNGHFFQALNLFDCGCRAINGDTNRHYTVGEDAALREALQEGVPSLVLRHEAPRAARAKIAALLNSKREFFWALGEDGSVDTSKMVENTSYCSQFEWLSKGMDAVQVDCLVRTHLGIKESKRIQG